MAQRKSDIRSSIRSRRARRPRPTSDSEAHDLLGAWLGALEALGSSSPRLPALFVPTHREPDVHLIIDSTPSCLLPVLVDASGESLPDVAWARSARGDELEDPSGKGPAQPTGPVLGPQALADADVVLVAALSVDKVGTRIGQGGGWYDRALERRRRKAPVIAAVFADEVVSGLLPVEAHDVPVDAVITEKGFRILR